MTGNTAADKEWQVVADLIPQFYGYLRDNAPAHQSLAAAIPVLSAAIADYRARQSPDPYAAIRKVWTTIEAQCQQDPTIPQP